ncbi:hypothetical protein AVEN_256891-1 [Araneus ventricosus]|uniref:Uncharacterized protein n=1 Tax=Araneus ventricosus TaxID=182803 RepID=A0A4Y2CHB7_ARAVE|nr:hypothetical protein AVEN_256891-1 [Araneus ventricosus]
MAKPKLEMRHPMQNFDSKEGDISLYLILFERQARRVEINEDLWVSHLIGLLPYDMLQLIARESEEVSNDYLHIKKLLFKRYKFSAEKFRQKFNNHTKSADNNWTDFLYELRNYFEEWLKGLAVKTFAELSDLIVTEQIKRRVPCEIKEHFIDEWANIKSQKYSLKGWKNMTVFEAFGRKSLTVVLQRRDFQLGRLNLQLKVRHPFRSRRKNMMSRNQPQILKISKKEELLGVINAGLRSMLDQIVPC